MEPGFLGLPPRFFLAAMLAYKPFLAAIALRVHYRFILARHALSISLASLSFTQLIWTLRNRYVAVDVPNIRVPLLFEAGQSQ